MSNCAADQVTWRLQSRAQSAWSDVDFCHIKSSRVFKRCKNCLCMWIEGFESGEILKSSESARASGRIERGSSSVERIDNITFQTNTFPIFVRAGIEGDRFKITSFVIVQTENANVSSSSDLEFCVEMNIRSSLLWLTLTWQEPGNVRGIFFSKVCWFEQWGGIWWKELAQSAGVQFRNFSRQSDWSKYCLNVLWFSRFSYGFNNSNRRVRAFVESKLAIVSSEYCAVWSLKKKLEEGTVFIRMHTSFKKQINFRILRLVRTNLSGTLQWTAKKLASPKQRRCHGESILNTRSALTKRLIIDELITYCITKVRIGSLGNQCVCQSNKYEGDPRSPVHR